MGRGHRLLSGVVQGGGEGEVPLGGGAPEVLRGGRGAGGAQGDLALPYPWTRGRVPLARAAAPLAGAGGRHHGSQGDGFGGVGGGGGGGGG